MPAHHAAEDTEASQLPLVLCTSFIISIRGPGHPRAHLVAAVLYQCHWPACCSQKNKGILGQAGTAVLLVFVLAELAAEWALRVEAAARGACLLDDGVGGAWPRVAFDIAQYHKHTKRPGLKFFTHMTQEYTLHPHNGHRPCSMKQLQPRILYTHARKRLRSLCTHRLCSLDRKASQQQAPWPRLS